MSHAELIDEVANELDTWPGVGIERITAATALVRYEQVVLGLLDRDRHVAELPSPTPSTTSSSNAAMPSRTPRRPTSTSSPTASKAPPT